MKISCKNISSIPNIGSIKDLAQHEHLVLEFPKEEMSLSNGSELISELKEKLPENYLIFNSGIWEHTVTITIKSVLSTEIINQNIGFIIEGIKDYLHISKTLLKNNSTNRKNTNDWELIEEHGEHKRYENKDTGQVLETCSCQMASIKDIDPYFWGVYIKSSTNHAELKKIINSEFHDSCRILEFIENNNELKKQITLKHLL
ncbi:MAG: hypothetical protein GY756_02840 [bacterium]|nr:hypothetical protein [bacterium]